MSALLQGVVLTKNGEQIDCGYPCSYAASTAAHRLIQPFVSAITRLVVDLQALF